MDSAAPLPHPVVSREDWLAARIALKAEEKRVLREYDALAAQRRALPWVKVDKLYVFDTPSGPRTLSDLFAGRSQLIVQHFMFAPEWEEGCVGCSLGPTICTAFGRIWKTTTSSLPACRARPWPN
ncbi:hypothetical protein ABI_39000 [Asticcacaulis biprosthecium C19]|uniref:DUF899 domain-containing protein n=1 Tax=Asticcacaulis biprosthecium C19 TaxID=715226 RepID=F4QRW6_9CAUL|nr:DUF899 family protein [Asticcacaulis biprosthecium]EGF89486.1 hypothetical protein ABI_39000 [Asticcacaulis biprosthecium C19]